MTIPNWLDIPVLCLLIIIVMGFLCLLWRSLIVLNKSVIKLWAEIGSLWVAVRKLTELFESLETDCSGDEETADGEIAFPREFIDRMQANHDKQEEEGTD